MMGVLKSLNRQIFIFLLIFNDTNFASLTVETLPTTADCEMKMFMKIPYTFSSTNTNAEGKSSLSLSLLERSDLSTRLHDFFLLA